jgi:hypothetical protein
MKTPGRKKVKRALVGLAAFLLAIRLLAFFVARPISLSMYNGLERLALDDELPALAIPLSRVLFWPFDKKASLAVFGKIVQHNRRDMLVFKASEILANRLNAQEARQELLPDLRQLRVAPCNQKYLVAALLPLAKRAGAIDRSTRIGTILDGYAFVGRPWSLPDLGQTEQCALYQKNIEFLIARLQPPASEVTFDID